MVAISTLYAKRRSFDLPVESEVEGPDGSAQVLHHSLRVVYNPSAFDAEAALRLTSGEDNQIRLAVDHLARLVRRIQLLDEQGVPVPITDDDGQELTEVRAVLLKLPVEALNQILARISEESRPKEAKPTPSSFG
jgi:hypothetical protein